MSQCSSCRARVIWATTAANNKPICLDAELVGGGNVELVAGVATVVKPSPDVRRYRAHFASCPNAVHHRRSSRART
jgi:hypothetical protein